MEFQFRAGDERPPPSTDAAATSADSKSAAKHVQDSHGCHSTGYHGENAVPLPPPASDPDGLLRQVAKAVIRELLLREETEKLAELVAEVRRELMEERISLFRSGQGRSVGALSSVTTPPSSGMTQTRIELEEQSKANASLDLPVKRKHTDVTVMSTASILTSSKKQKLNLNCMVCGISATSEKVLQDHLKGKVHMRKAARLAQPTAEAGDDEVMQVHSKANALRVLPEEKENPNIVKVTSSKTQKLDLTCKICGVTSTSQKMMQAHLEGRTHKRKVTTFPQPMPEEAPSNANVPTDASILSAAASDKKQKLDLTCTACGISVTCEKGMKDHLKGKVHRKKAAAVVSKEAEHGEEEKEEEAEHGQEEKEEEGSFTPNKINLQTNNGAICEVIQMDGSVFCELCNQSTPDLVTMMCHLQGTKHISKARLKAATPPATATIAATIADGDPQTVAMRINGVLHTVRRVGGSLLCELCDVKVPSVSEGVMRSHLSGRMHTNKMKAVAAVDIGAAEKAERITKDVALATNFHITETPVQEVMKEDGADTIGGSGQLEAKSKEPSHVAGTATVMVVEQKADTEKNNSQMQEMEVVERLETDGIAVVPADEEVKYQVGGKEFIVLRQLDGKLSCRLCAVHGCEKQDMINHIYTHLDK